MKKIQPALTTVAISIALASCLPTPVPLPDWPTQAPAPAPPPIVIPGWEGVVLQSICLELDQSYQFAGEPYILDSVSDDPLKIREVTEDFLSGIGIEVSTDMSSCDGIVKVSVMGRTLAGNYSGLGTCHNGEEISVQLALVIDELEFPMRWYSASQDPPGSISRCVNIKSPDKFSRAVLLKAMFYPLVEPWGSTAYGSALVNVHCCPDQILSSSPSTPRDELRISSMRTEIAPEELSVAVSFLIKSLNDPDERIRTAAVNALGHIGPLSKESIPYIIRYWEEFRGDRYRTNFALNQIEGFPGPSLEDWKKWWNDHSEEFLTE